MSEFLTIVASKLFALASKPFYKFFSSFKNRGCLRCGWSLQKGPLYIRTIANHSIIFIALLPNFLQRHSLESGPTMTGFFEEKFITAVSSITVLDSEIL